MEPIQVLMVKVTLVLKVIHRLLEVLTMMNSI